MQQLKYVLAILIDLFECYNFHMLRKSVSPMYRSFSSPPTVTPSLPFLFLDGRVCWIFQIILVQGQGLFPVYSVIYRWEVGYRRVNKRFDQKVLVNVSVFIVYL